METDKRMKNYLAAELTGLENKFQNLIDYI